MKQAKASQPTIYDVANLAGLSIATVSRVLNTPDQVSSDTRSKVMAAIDQLGYVPKAEARARALQNKHRIGVLTPFLTAPSFVERLRGINLALVNTNGELIIYTVDSNSRLKGYLSSLPLTGRLDGLVIMSLPIEEDECHRLLAHGLQTVLIEFHAEGVSSVEIDNQAGGRLAARYLLGKGHRKVAFIGDLDPPDYAIRPVADRFEGFREGLSQAGVDLPNEFVRSSPYQREPTQQAAQALLSLPVRPTAIFAAADIQAIATLKAARDMNLRVPQDLAIIGFDDLEMAEYLGLTTIRQSLDDSGKLAAEMLMARLEDPVRPVQHIQLPLEIVERETV